MNSNTLRNRYHLCTFPNRGSSEPPQVHLAVYIAAFEIQYAIITSDLQRTEESWVFSAASVCLFVCQHDDFRTSKYRMMKHGVSAVYKNLGRLRIWGSQPPGCAPPKCGVGLRRWENQRRLSSCTLESDACFCPHSILLISSRDGSRLSPWHTLDASQPG